MNNAVLTTKLALTRWQQQTHHLATIFGLCETLGGFDEPSRRSVQAILNSLQKEFKLADELLDYADHKQDPAKDRARPHRAA